MEGTTVSGQFFTSLYLNDFAIRVELLDLLKGQMVFLRVQAGYKDTIFYAKEIEVGHESLLSLGVLYSNSSTMKCGERAANSFLRKPGSALM